MFVTGGRVREALGSTGVRGRDRFKNRANRGSQLRYSRDPRFGERKYWQDSGKVIGTRELPNLRTDAALGKKWFSLDRSSECRIPLKKEQECGIRDCYQLVPRNFTIKKNLSNAGKYFI